MQYLEIKIHENVATLLLDRPQRHGALSPRLLEDLRQALRDIHQEKRVRSVIVTARGEHFSSGVDLHTFHEISQLPEREQWEQWFQYWRQLAETCEEMLRFPKPLIAAVDGAAIGAGLAIALSCDLMLATDRSSFSAGAVRRGLAGGITTALLAFRVGTAVAAKMSLSGLTMDASQMDAAGLLADRPAPVDQIWVTATKWAKDCAVGSPEAVAATKRMLNETIGEALLSQIASAAADSATLCTTESAAEGISAFLDRRTPVWP